MSDEQAAFVDAPEQPQENAAADSSTPSEVTQGDHPPPEDVAPASEPAPLEQGAGEAAAEASPEVLSGQPEGGEPVAESKQAEAAGAVESGALPAGESAPANESAAANESTPADSQPQESTNEAAADAPVTNTELGGSDAQSALTSEQKPEADSQESRVTEEVPLSESGGVLPGQPEGGVPVEESKEPEVAGSVESESLPETVPAPVDVQQTEAAPPTQDAPTHDAPASESSAPADASADSGAAADSSTPSEVTQSDHPPPEDVAPASEPAPLEQGAGEAAAEASPEVLSGQPEGGVSVGESKEAEVAGAVESEALPTGESTPAAADGEKAGRQFA